MIEIAVPVEQIPYIRTIEGRRFHAGKWQFPESARKRLEDLELISSSGLSDEPQRTQFETRPFLRQYQKDIVNDALNAGSYGIFSDTGTGKTIMGLEIASHYKKALILCPLSVIETAWIDDCNRFYPDKQIVNVWGTSKSQRQRKLLDNADIFVMNYESFKILKNDIRKMDFDCMIIDESSAIKSMTSQITSDVLSFSSLIPHRFVLSGCPTPNHNSEIFPQMKFVDPDLFGNNYYGFLARYFHQDMANPHAWYQTEEDKERYFARLSEKSVFLKKDDCLDLPEKVFQVRRFDMMPKQRDTYDGILNDIERNINQWSKVEFTARMMKLREVESGFVIRKDGSVVDFDNGKKALLLEVLNELRERPVIVWCQFRHEIEKLASDFNGVALTSQTSDRDAIIRAFKRGEIQLLFTHPKLIGKGLTFSNCTYNIYYSLSFSYEEFKQSQDRIHRIGQTKKCTYIILQARDSIAERIYESVQRKGNAVDELYVEMGLKGAKQGNKGYACLKQHA